MKRLSVTKKVASLLWMGVIMITALLSWDVSAQQVKDTNIAVTICPAPNTSSFTVSEPQSDSVVKSASVAIKGTASSIERIDVFVDDEYKKSVTVSESSVSYHIDVVITPGTHTIKLIAIEKCQQAQHNKSLVLTYEPQAAPGAPQAPDDVPRAGGGPIFADDDLPTESPAPAPSEGLAKLPVIRPVEDVARGLDVDATLSGGIWDGVWRTASVITGLVLITALPAVYAARTRFKNAAQQGSVSKPKPVNIHKHHHHMIMRLFGFILFVAPFLV